MMKKTVFTLFIIGIAISVVFATTWFETKKKCPICGKTNKFQEIGSYGSYIYQWPEKLEYIYWPVTESYSLYSCSKCKYSAFMWDFDRIKNDTIKLIKNKISGLKLNVKGYKDKMSNKLEAAERIYKLYNTNTDFWCKFYRIKGYHYYAEGDSIRANCERLKALKIADSISVLPENEYRRKELLLISGSMKHFTHQDSSAIHDITIALSLKFNSKEYDSTRNSNFNSYLDGVLNELKGLIAKRE